MLHRWSTGTASPLESPERGGPDRDASRPQPHRLGHAGRCAKLPGQASRPPTCGTAGPRNTWGQQPPRGATFPPRAHPGRLPALPVGAHSGHKKRTSRHRLAPRPGWFFARTLAPAQDHDREPTRPEAQAADARGQHWPSAAISRCCRPPEAASGVAALFCVRSTLRPRELRRCGRCLVVLVLVGLDLAEVQVAVDEHRRRRPRRRRSGGARCPSRRGSHHISSSGHHAGAGGCMAQTTPRPISHEDTQEWTAGCAARSSRCRRRRRGPAS